MNDLEDAVRSALHSMPEPQMALPLDYPAKLRRKYQHQRLYASTALAGIGAAAAIAAVTWHPEFGSHAPATPAASPSPSLSPRALVVIPTQQVTEAALPGWTDALNDSGLTAWSGSPHAFTVAGSPVFVVGESVPGTLGRTDPANSLVPQAAVVSQRTQAQVDETVPAATFPKVLPSGSANPALNAQAAIASGAATPGGTHSCATGGAGIEGNYGLTSPTLMQLRCWPTLEENVWVWSRLPSGVATIAYVLAGQVVARATPLDGVGAIRLPRPASAAAEQGQLEALTSTGAVVAHVTLPWMA